MITTDIIKNPDTMSAVWLLFGVIPNVGAFAKDKQKSGEVDQNS